MNKQQHAICSLILSLVLFQFTVQAQEVTAPDLQYVSINPYTNEISVAWNKSPNTNIDFTRIHYVYDKSDIIKAKTVCDIYENKNDTLVFKTDTIAAFTAQAHESPLSFAVDAYTTTNENSISLNNYHTTMIVESTIQACDAGITLSWNSYEGSSTTVEEYHIIEVADDDTESIIQSLSPSQTEYTVPPSEDTVRKFFIRASLISNGTPYSSTSQMTTITKNSYNVPDFLSITSLTYNTKNKLTLHIRTTPDTDISKYVIERAFQNKNYFSHIDTISHTSHKETFSYTVPYTHNSDSLFFYKVSAIDSCDNIIISSNIVNPTELQIQTLSEHEHLLSWKKGLIWENDYAEVYVYRITNIYDTAHIATLPPQEIMYQDEITNFAIDPQICYQIVGTQTTETDSYTAESNIACVKKESHLYVPNTFNPHSAIEENRIFKPKYAYISGTYSLKVYSRNGSEIFSSNDINKGWDGTINTKQAPEGMYLYAIHITLPNGDNISKNGAINLILHNK
ncbi:MAG: gliding motility-associated C-terminal domain-containing protein [Bacteroidales bacterium]